MTPTPEPQRILVVEDDPGVRLSLRVAFERQGFLVEEVATGGEGLERVTLRATRRGHPRSHVARP